MTIGSSTETQISTTLNINFVKQLTILGIKVDSNLTNVTENNIQLKIPAIKHELSQWKRRCLTPIGRIAIVKALRLSKLVHLFIALPNPSIQCVKELEKLLFRFVWGNKMIK